MDIKIELIIVCKFLVSLLLGALIGFDRERRGSAAGIRTYAAVCIGSTLFTAIGAHIENDPGAVSRILANIITGVGFLGAGIIYRNSNSDTSHGLTTAATVWCTAAVGVAVGLDMYVIAIVASSIIYFLLALHQFTWYLKLKKKWKDKKYDNHKNNNE
jgi:putative Mg2+ transporter-C (MgtC) family protein